MEFNGQGAKIRICLRADPVTARIRLYDENECDDEGSRADGHDRTLCLRGKGWEDHLRALLFVRWGEHQLLCFFFLSFFDWSMKDLSGFFILRINLWISLSCCSSRF